MGLDISKLPKSEAPSMPTARGLFDGVNESQVFESGQYFNETGSYIVSVKKNLVKFLERKGCDGFIWEFEILEDLGEKHAQYTTNKETGVTTYVGEGAPPVPGSLRSYVQKLDNKRIAFPVLKAYILACFNPKTPQERATVEGQVRAVLDRIAAGETDLLAGTKLRLDVIHKVTEKKIDIYPPQFKAVD